MIRSILFVTFMTLLLLPMSLNSNRALTANEAKISSEIFELAKTGKFSVLLKLKQQADLTSAKYLHSKEERGRFVYDQLTKVARDSQDSLLNNLRLKNLKTKSFYIQNMIAVFDVDLNMVKKLANYKEVSQVVANPIIKGLPTLHKNIRLAGTQHSSKGIEENLVKFGAKQVWDEFNVRGEGIVIAGQDTGIDWDHPALKTQYRGWDGSNADHRYNWHDAISEKIASSTNPCGYATTEPCDDHAHGTHTIGTVVGDDGKGNQIGVAPKAQWIGCRNMDSGYGRPSTYIECFEFFLAPYVQGEDPKEFGRPEFAPHVINNSWGCPKDEGCVGSEILPIIETLNAAGILVVASAGNEGSSCGSIGSPPAMHSLQTLSVGAHSHKSGSIASFSSRGPSTFDGEVGPDVTAPGVNIRSSVPGGGYQGAFWSGTSMAGPHVVGQVALLWSADNSLIGDIANTMEIIKSTASNKTTSQSCGGVSGSSIPNNTFGFGHANAYKAVASRL